jgi:beta-mannosidase
VQAERPAGAPGFVYFDDNYFSLLPGETRTIRADWRNVPEHARHLSVQGWNCHADL